MIYTFSRYLSLLGGEWGKSRGGEMCLRTFSVFEKQLAVTRARIGAGQLVRNTGIFYLGAMAEKKKERKKNSQSS